MMQSIMPIGSILEKDDSKIIVLGYQINPTDLELLYKCAQYPFGYINEEESFYINSTIDFNVCHKGYINDQFDIVVNLLNEIKSAYKQYGMEEINNSIDDMINTLNEKLKREEGVEK